MLCSRWKCLGCIIFKHWGCYTLMVFAIMCWCCPLICICFIVPYSAEFENVWFDETVHNHNELDDTYLVCGSSVLQVQRYRSCMLWWSSQKNTWKLWLSLLAWIGSMVPIFYSSLVYIIYCSKTAFDHHYKQTRSLIRSEKIGNIK